METRAPERRGSGGNMLCVHVCVHCTVDMCTYSPCMCVCVCTHAYVCVCLHVCKRACVCFHGCVCVRARVFMHDICLWEALYWAGWGWFPSALTDEDLCDDLTSKFVLPLSWPFTDFWTYIVLQTPFSTALRYYRCKHWRSPISAASFAAVLLLHFGVRIWTTSIANYISMYQESVLGSPDKGLGKLIFCPLFCCEKLQGTVGQSCLKLHKFELLYSKKSIIYSAHYSTYVG